MVLIRMCPTTKPGTYIVSVTIVTTVGMLQMILVMIGMQLFILAMILEV